MCGPAHWYFKKSKGTVNYACSKYNETKYFSNGLFQKCFKRHFIVKVAFWKSCNVKLLHYRVLIITECTYTYMSFVSYQLYYQTKESTLNSFGESLCAPQRRYRLFLFHILCLCLMSYQVSDELWTLSTGAKQLHLGRKLNSSDVVEKLNKNVERLKKY